MITVVIPYDESSKIGFVQLLVSLQPQLHPDDDVYVLDRSVDRSAKELVERYGSSRSYIFVEPTQEKDAFPFAFQSVKENKQEGALVISPRCVISTTLVANLKRLIKRNDEYDFFVPDHSIVADGMMDGNFNWFGASLPEKLVSMKWSELHLDGYNECFYVRSRLIKDDFSIDEMAEGVKTAVFSNELVVVLPTS